MKIVLVCKGKPIWELDQLTAELESRGHVVSVVNPSFSLDDLATDTFWQPYLEADVVYYRTGFGDALRRVLFERLMEHGVGMVNEVLLKETLLANKIYQAIQAQRVGALVPQTLIGRGREYDVVVEKLGAPFVLKAAEGIQGEKVFLVTSLAEYKEHVEKLSGDILLQRFIPNHGDFRVFVVGGYVQAIFQRIPKEGDFRANISQGGSGRAVPKGELYEALSHIALKVVSAEGLDIAGVDIMQSTETGELFFIEANVNPGWKGLENAIGVRVTDKVADFIEAKARD